MSEKRLLVFGSRTWQDAKAIARAVASIAPDVVVEGGAPGADLMAREAARRQAIRVESFPVDNAKDGPWPAAGHRRNRRMHNEGRPTEAVAFISGKRGEPYSRGSQGMAYICRLAGTPLRVFREDGEEA